MSRQDLLFSLQPESPPAASGAKPVLKNEEKAEGTPKWVSNDQAKTSFSVKINHIKIVYISS